MEWILELILIVLLAATLFHAIRLERALGVLKRDRAQLQELVAGFNASTQAAEQGIARLRATADGAGRTMARQIDASQRLRDDLTFLSERGERIADQLEHLVRAGRVLTQDTPVPEPPRSAPAQAPDDSRPRSQAEQDLLRALRVAR